MDIKDIKNKLTISEVIKYYGLKADKQAMKSFKHWQQLKNRQ